MKHITVLQTEAIDALALKPQSVVVDATYGSGGHARLICEQLGSQGIYIGIDADKTAFLNNPLSIKTQNKPTIHLINDNFSNLDELLSSLHIENVDGNSYRLEAFGGWVYTFFKRIFWQAAGYNFS